MYKGVNEMSVTINNIAKEAGVSLATVSRVINNSGYVKDETREKVMKVINKYNYTLVLLLEVFQKVLLILLEL